MICFERLREINLREYRKRTLSPCAFDIQQSIKEKKCGEVLE